MTIPSAVTSIEQGELARMIVSGDPVQILDVRRAPAFEKNPLLLPGAIRVAPDTVASWAASAGAYKSVPLVVYCVYGHEVSQGAAVQLKALGFDARYLQGGISEWQISGGATVAT